MKISFIASLANGATAISISDDGAVRLKLDIAESELSESVKMVLFKGQTFRVTIEPCPDMIMGLKEIANDSAMPTL